MLIMKLYRESKKKKKLFKILSIADFENELMVAWGEECVCVKG